MKESGDQIFKPDHINLYHSSADVELLYPTSIALNELQVKCGECGETRTFNRLRYHKHFGKSEFLYSLVPSLLHCLIMAFPSSFLAQITGKHARQQLKVETSVTSLLRLEKSNID